MGRPTAPLVDRDDAISRALDIIDRDGLKALSLRRLGSDLGVSAAALYHHFADKQEILRGVVDLVFATEIVTPVESESWEEHVLHSIARYRAALVAHPNAAPLMTLGGPSAPPLDNVPREFIVRKMLKEGVPERYCYPIIESAAMLAFGSAMMNPKQLSPAERFQLDESTKVAGLRRVIDGTYETATELFSLELRALIRGWRAILEED
ncbi:TetR/AcrR family transcriptional regulator [Pseudofrankia inefficax]|uniref:Regulatory protein TetR n=1 Tax=Pseudofrankia inefficax (strain DSM 45817 / CECT 9037 / DDB 130130 / EuI1c) TaxID=298654 RepID=E3IXV8_PSEI1|nr:TetR family transcriptional regulator [Pseudofrankia inefficax]ADP81413.1 regulatory protein TetR [Pseudofrankia inefficax]